MERSYSLLIFLSRRVHALTFGQAPLVQLTGLWALHFPSPSACASRLALVLLLGPTSCTGGQATRMDATCSGACTSTWPFTWTASTLTTVRTHRCLVRFDALRILSFLYYFCDISIEVTARPPHESAANTLKPRCIPFTLAPFIADPPILSSSAENGSATAMQGRSRLAKRIDSSACRVPSSQNVPVRPANAQSAHSFF